MNIKELHQEGKVVSAISLFKGGDGIATAIQLKEKSTLKEHITKMPALLLCVCGKIEYHDEKGQKVELKGGDYINIEPEVKHWLYALEASQLVLLK